MSTNDAILGLGVTAPGKILLACGTAWVVTGVTDAPDVAALPPSLDLNFYPAPHLPGDSRNAGPDRVRQNVAAVNGSKVAPGTMRLVRNREILCVDEKALLAEARAACAMARWI